MKPKPNLWKFTLRHLAMVQSEREPFIEYVILRATTERDAVLELKTNKFTELWWEEHLILDVSRLGELWHIAAGVA